MRRTLFLVVLLAGCGADGKPGPEPHPKRQQPSVTEPGLHVSGHADIGVVRSF